jgi:alkanesulfonate monooxygenase SsuD/methylene tetrahydromethanopterin reductase-like flavin-dependent oxidoreductase (luciferase family)
MSDEYLAAIIELWTKDSPQFEGKYVSFKDVVFEPKPVQKPHLPIWMGGDAEPVLKRAARYASGCDDKFGTHSGRDRHQRLFGLRAVGDRGDQAEATIAG